MEYDDDTGVNTHACAHTHVYTGRYSMYKTSTSMKDEGGSNIYFVHVSRYRTLNQHKLSVFSCIYVCGVYVVCTSMKVYFLY